MSPDAAVEWLSKNWQVLASAPWVFVTLAIVVAGLGYIVGPWYRSGEFSILERRIADLERRIAEYEKKVGASLDDARGKINHLEGELAGLNKVLGVTVGTAWAPLTSQEISDLSLALRNIPKHRVQLMYVNQLGKSLAETLREAFLKADWSDIMFSDGGGNHFGIIAGPGANKAGALKFAIEASTRLKVSVNKPNAPERAEVVYLSVGINPPDGH
jgi:hypothetical protein